MSVAIQVNAATAAWWRAVTVVARAERLLPSEIVQPRGYARRRARQVAAYLAVTRGDVPTVQLARAARTSRCAVQNALARVEDGRDDPAFDHVIATLEEQMAHA